MTDTLAIRSNTVSTVKDQLDFILLDGSGSMANKWWDMLKAIDAYVQTLKWDNIESQLRLDVFDSHDIALTMRDCPIADWKTFAEDPIGAHFGSTPLYDAIVMMGKTLRDLNPPRCAITIVTDGEEAGSRFADITQARAILDWCRAHGWQVTFIGCDFANDRQAKALGANETNSIGVQKALLEDAARAYAKKRASYAKTGQDINFTGDEKQQFGGYLGHSGGKS